MYIYIYILIYIYIYNTTTTTTNNNYYYHTLRPDTLPSCFVARCLHPPAICFATRHHAICFAARWQGVLPSCFVPSCFVARSLSWQGVCDHVLLLRGARDKRSRPCFAPEPEPEPEPERERERERDVCIVSYRVVLCRVGSRVSRHVHRVVSCRVVWYRIERYACVYIYELCAHRDAM